VLDAYAVRIGRGTWSTSLSAAGVATVRQLLRGNATRATAVACFESGTGPRPRLVWTVGRVSAFSDDGRVAVSTRRQRATRPVVSHAVRTAGLLADGAGVLHDLGKFGGSFQEKLRSTKPVADPVRHEWLSLQVLKGMRAGKGWQEAWAAPLVRMGDLVSGSLAGGVSDALGALEFLVFTHHRLPGLDGTLLCDHTYTQKGGAGVAAFKPPVGAPASTTWRRAAAAVRRLAEVRCEFGAEGWRAVAILARIALILADHSVSGRDVSRTLRKGTPKGLLKGERSLVFANTVARPGRSRAMNQELDWHLQEVGTLGGRLVFECLHFSPPGLSVDGTARLANESAGRFAWQNVAAQALRGNESTAPEPTLVLNLAGTGSGKTRMNARAVASLRPSQPVRISTALNLITLTLQTRDSYIEELGLSQDEVACIVGSMSAETLHAASKGASAGRDEDDNPLEDTFEAIGDAEPPPEWLRPFFERRQGSEPLLMAPVAVCTTDFLVAAGEPNRQAHHGLAMLRLMSSDLVLDEVDSYDPKALVAVMRMVTASAMWGRHVIASSATISAPVAKALYRAYELGARMRSALTGTKAVWRQAFIDDLVAPCVTSTEKAEDFLGAYSAHMRAAHQALGVRRFRPAELQALKLSGTGREQGAFFSAVAESVARMQRRHGWVIETPQGEHTVSIGVVRVAHIKTAMALARNLSGISDSRIACYHSQLPAVQRFHIEHSLRQALTRKAGAPGPGQAMQVLEVVQQRAHAGARETHFVVVATPVIEVGQDLDFDWSVIEPSSAQSIVQMAGRVNRHRLADVAEPNVSVLQFNFAHCTRGASAPAFMRPGYEPSDDGRRYSTHDLGRLLDWSHLGECGQIDSRLRFQTERHLLSELDDRGIAAELGVRLEPFLDSRSPAWIAEETYTLAPLRERTRNREVWTRLPGGEYARLEVDGYSREFVQRAVETRSRVGNDWLVLDFDDAAEMSSRLGLSLESGMRVEIFSGERRDDKRPCHDLSFGFV
jgi:CRISPR-associated endonuclease/helicase Cas3